jgi:hypothetical protein
MLILDLGMHIRSSRGMPGRSITDKAGCVGPRRCGNRLGC